MQTELSEYMDLRVVGLSTEVMLAVKKTKLR